MELRCISTHEADRGFWVHRFQQHGAKRGGPTAGASLVTSQPRVLPTAEVPAGLAMPAMGASNVDSLAVTAMGTMAPNGYDCALHPEVWEVCHDDVGNLYYYHLATGKSQWVRPTSDYLEGEEPAAPATATAAVGGALAGAALGALTAGGGEGGAKGGFGGLAGAAGGALASPGKTDVGGLMKGDKGAMLAAGGALAAGFLGGGGAAAAAAAVAAPSPPPVDPVAAALADAETERIGMLERFHESKGVLKPAGFRPNFFEVKAGRLAAYGNEESYRNGAAVKAGHDLDLTKYILLEALAVVGIGPSYATLANAADEGKTLTLQAVDPATAVPVIWQLRCATPEARKGWGLTLMANGVARPALSAEVS